MGKKSSARSKRQQEDSDSDDAGGVEINDGSVPSTPTVADESAGSGFDMSEAVDMLTEKKANMREPALQKIIAYLQSNRVVSEEDCLEDYQETLEVQLVRMLRRPPSVREGSLVCTLVSLLALYHGAGCSQWFSQVEKPLQQLVDGKGEEFEDLRVPALKALTFVAFVCGSDSTLRHTLEFLMQVLLFESLESSGVVHYSAALKAAAVDGFVLLSSGCPDKLVLERSRDDDLVDALLAMLQYDANDITSIVSAGKALGYLWETALSVICDEEEGQEPNYLMSNNPRSVDDALDEIRRIAKESTKKVSKKNKKEQRAEFREIIDLLDEGNSPVECIHMQGADVEVEGFAQARIAEALRQALGSGFHSSLRVYPVVRDMLHVEFLTDDNDGGGGRDKVLKGSLEEKRRGRDRRQDREFRDAYTAFDEDDY